MAPPTLTAGKFSKASAGTAADRPGKRMQRDAEADAAIDDDVRAAHQPGRDNAAELAAMDAWLAGGYRTGVNARKRAADAGDDGNEPRALVAKRPRVQPDTAAGTPARRAGSDAGTSARAALRTISTYTATAADNERAGDACAGVSSVSFSLSTS